MSRDQDSSDNRYDPFPTFVNHSNRLSYSLVVRLTENRICIFFNPKKPVRIFIHIKLLLLLTLGAPETPPFSLLPLTQFPVPIGAIDLSPREIV